VFLKQLSITHLRNISSAKLTGLAHFNLITGCNGSGKTSLLEAIYLLGMSKSFRTSKVKNVISHDHTHCLLVAKDNDGITLGLERDNLNNLQIKYDGRHLKSAAELADIFPIQLINEETFGLLIAGPQVRRRFMDWGVFHVEHLFYPAWMDAQKSLKHRNALLKQYKTKIPQQLLDAWTARFVECSEKITVFRQQWFDLFNKEIGKTVEQIAPHLSEVTFKFYCGWDISKPLADCLDSSLITDQQRGFTGYGPQRADIRVRYQGQPAEEVLSRGQQKMIVAAMKIAQARVLASIGKKSSYIVDDLAAELDKDNSAKLLACLLTEAKQVFLTAIEINDLPDVSSFSDGDIAMFHVEHGQVSRSS